MDSKAQKWVLGISQVKDASFYSATLHMALFQIGAISCQ